MNVQTCLRCCCVFFLIMLGTFDFLPNAHSQNLIFENDFNDDATGIYTVAMMEADWNTPQWNNGVSEQRASIVDNAEAFDGKSLAVSYPQGLHGSNTTGAQWILDLGQGYEDLTMEYRVKFGAGFDFVRGGKLPGLVGGEANTGGDKPDGTDGWSARMHWRTGGSSGSQLSSDKANISQYLYHVDQPTDFGEDFRWDDAPSGDWSELESDRWYHIKNRIVMNTPGQNDGIVQAWLDDELVLDLNNIRFRDVANLQIDKFYFSTFFGGSGDQWSTTDNEIAYFDDFRITTSVPEPSAAFIGLLMFSGGVLTRRRIRN